MLRLNIKVYMYVCLYIHPLSLVLPSLITADKLSNICGVYRIAGNFREKKPFLHEF